MNRGEKRQDNIKAVALANALALEKEDRKSDTYRLKFGDGDLVLVRDF